jgi:hypothetical protein
MNEICQFRKSCRLGSFSNLSPCPPSLSKGRGSIDKRGAKPLSWVSSPSPLKERGIKGVGLINNLFIEWITFW